MIQGEPGLREFVSPSLQDCGIRDPFLIVLTA